MRGCNHLRKWRSNLCFSAIQSTASRSLPLLSRWYSSSGSASGPIHVEEFVEALKRVIPPEKWDPPKSQTIGQYRYCHAPLQYRKLIQYVGLAVSGGVDSMALAALFTDAKRIYPKLPTPHAIIADHGYRVESSAEANWVASVLKEKCEVGRNLYVQEL
jgi:3'-phosphoadenosine 5'-phosphosulfate sulfotransferase (PAPS reductase)/FAD synthetase